MLGFFSVCFVLSIFVYRCSFSGAEVCLFWLSVVCFLFEVLWRFALWGEDPFCKQIQDKGAPSFLKLLWNPGFKIDGFRGLGFGSLGGSNV